MWNYNTKNKTENEIYLEYQLEEERRWREEDQSRQQRERDERIRNIRNAYNDALRTADSWEEALENQAALTAAEAWREGLEWLEGHWYIGSHFSESRDACERALEMWPNEALKVADKIADLKRQIADLENSVRFSVGSRLAAEKMWNSSGWKFVADVLLDPDSDREDWLNW